MFMEGLCVLIEREYKPSKLFLPQKKKRVDVKRWEGVGWGGVGYRNLRSEKGTGKPQVFLGSLLGTCRSAIGQFFSLFLVTLPEVFANGNSSYGYYFTHGNRKRKRRIVREEWSVFLPERRWFRVYSWVVFTKT